MVKEYVQMLPGNPIGGETPPEQCEFLITRNLAKRGPNYRVNYRVVGPAIDYLYENNKQFMALVKTCNFGWKISSFVFDHQKREMAIGIQGPNCGAWLLPDGTLIRPAPGKTTAYLPKNWASKKSEEI